MFPQKLDYTHKTISESRRSNEIKRETQNISKLLEARDEVDSNETEEKPK